MTQPTPLKLSICIATFNRGALIGATLESIIAQTTNDCEVVILDGASTDDTERVVAEYSRRSDRLRYVRQDRNNGMDRDFDRVVQLARGEYCWLMSDDDLLKPGAVAAVLEALRRNYSLVVVAIEIRDSDLSTVLLPCRPNFDSARVYGPDEMDRLFDEAGHHVTYIACVVIKRSIWLDREREPYYGTLHVHVGVCFQKRLPGETLVMAEPLIIHRFGNQTWLPKASEMLSKWSSLVESLAISQSTKRKLSSQLSINLSTLLAWRAFGVYSLAEYRRWIRPRLRSTRDAVIPTLVALLPGVLVNAICVLYYSIVGSDDFARRGVMIMLRGSRFHVRNWLAFKGR